MSTTNLDRSVARAVGPRGSSIRRRLAAGSMLVVVVTGCGGGGADADEWCAELATIMGEDDADAIVATTERLADDVPDGVDRDDLGTAFGLPPAIDDFDDADAWNDAQLEYEAAVERVDGQIRDVCADFPELFPDG